MVRLPQQQKEFVPLDERLEGSKNQTKVYATEEEGEAVVPDAFARASEERHLVELREARAAQVAANKQKATFSTKVGNWFGIGDPYVFFFVPSIKYVCNIQSLT